MSTAAAADSSSSVTPPTVAPTTAVAAEPAVAAPTPAAPAAVEPPAAAAADASHTQHDEAHRPIAPSGHHQFLAAPDDAAASGGEAAVAGAGTTALPEGSVGPNVTYYVKPVDHIVAGKSDESVAPDGQRVVTTEIGEMNEIPSMCPTCQGQGVTRLMLTNIPHFREIIVSSFECLEAGCGERNSEIQFGGTYGAKHTTYELSVQRAKDMNRQVVKSEHATIRIPELELEMPPETQKGSLNTIEGLLVQMIEGLQSQQVVRRIVDPETAAKIDVFCAKVESMRTGEVPFTLVLDDPSGNSYIEGYYDYYHPTIDAQLTKYEVARTEKDRTELGLEADYSTRRTVEEERAVDDGELSEVMIMAEECTACRMPGELKMHKCDIPYFQETIIMAFRCDFCGYRTSEIKNGGAIPPRGTKITLTVLNESDLKRDVLKSNTASLSIPEVELELVAGTLGGFFSTVEGVIDQVVTQLTSTSQCSFAGGDSAAVDPEQAGGGMKGFLVRLTRLKAGEVFPFTVVLDDPMSSIYIQNPKAHLPPPENLDPQLVVEEYTRTFEQDEELGIHQMDC